MDKGQIWYMDFILGVTIFLLIIVIAFKMITNTYILPGKETSDIFAESGRLTDSLNSPGIPANWTTSQVSMIGITQESNILNITKLEQLENMTDEDYDNVKKILGIKSDFIFSFEGKNSTLINLTARSYIGKPNFTEQMVRDLGPQDLVTVIRYLVYRHDSIAEIIAMRISVWEE